jgi:hypothetical protein
LHGMADPEDESPLYFGFLVRGKPLEFFKKLASDLIELRKATRAALLEEGKSFKVVEVEGVIDPESKPPSPFDDGGL